MPSLSFDPDVGVSVPSTQEVREEIAGDLQDAFKTAEKSTPLNVDPTSPGGQIVDIITAQVEAKNAEVAYLANMYNPAVARGFFLDALAGLYFLTRKVSEPTVVTCTCTGLKGTVIPFGAIVQDTVGNQLRHMTVGGAMIGDAGTVDASFATVEHGPIEISAGSVTQIVTVVPGWDSVTNVAAGVTGRDVEPDAEFLNRIKESFAINSHGSVESIQSNLSELDGVLDCVVLENFTNEYQTQYEVRLEPHSIAICIVGGEDDAIAETIYRRKDLGCGTNGETQVTYIAGDHFNARYTYKIIRPTAAAFHVKIIFNSTGMPAETQQAVKNAVVSDFLGEKKNPRVKLATTVYASRFYETVQSASSEPVLDIQIYLDDDEPSNYVEIPANVEPALIADNVQLVFQGA